VFRQAVGPLLHSCSGDGLAMLPAVGHSHIDGDRISDLFCSWWNDADLWGRGLLPLYGGAAAQLRRKEPPAPPPGVRPHLGKFVVPLVTLGAIQPRLLPWISFLGADCANYSLFQFLLESVKRFNWKIGVKQCSSNR
jgi:hypothetical protein